MLLRSECAEVAAKDKEQERRRRATEGSGCPALYSADSSEMEFMVDSCLSLLLPHR